MDDLTALWKLLNVNGLPFSFSVWCRSGFVGREKCGCWRCRQERGEEVTAETELQAQEEAKRLDDDYAEQMRAFFRKRHATF